MADHFIRVENIQKHYSKENSLFRARGETIKAVDGVSFTIDNGETLGLVGESGCGKSTLGRTMLMLEKLTAGNIFFEGSLLNSLAPEKLRLKRRKMQCIYQDPFSALNPRMKVRQIIAEPFKVHRIFENKKKVNQEVVRLIQIVGLKADDCDKYPHEFSGGQRQRISIARALALQPKFIVADEPVSALDVSIQSQIINLLKDLQAEFKLSYLFITHDLRVVGYISNRVAVMYLGRLIELADTESLFEKPLHPYTMTLISSIPGRRLAREKIILEGEPPSPLNPPSGCHFHPRCFMAKDNCRIEQPTLRQISQNHWIACHWAV